MYKKVSKENQKESELSMNISKGDIVRHFKRELIKADEKDNQYLYVIRDIAEHTESHEILVVYQSLYGNFQVYARPLEMFCEEVDHEKYPEVKQKFRFEKHETVQLEL